MGGVWTLQLQFRIRIGEHSSLILQEGNQDTCHCSHSCRRRHRPYNSAAPRSSCMSSSAPSPVQEKAAIASHPIVSVPLAFGPPSLVSLKDPRECRCHYHRQQPPYKICSRLHPSVAFRMRIWPSSTVPLMILVIILENLEDLCPLTSKGVAQLGVAFHEPVRVEGSFAQAHRLLAVWRLAHESADRARAGLEGPIRRAG